MGFVKEFKEFAFKGNVLDLAVGVMIGAAFGKIVTSLVEDLITPLLLTPALEAAGVENIAQWSVNGVYWGKFIAAIISFLAIAMVLFWLIKAANKVTKPAEAAPEAPSSTDQLLMEIRDELKRK
ncbi:large conductance mechanosensitive channel protein MscL [Chryseobacterium taklimakanense]|uniref:large conductance mechanosensitive channel protein MscL n=1 Tax=Chryseobacterium taklimakanense TaxID=536441 RepID=UPI001EF436AB|nr:large conductance mechanosensitive channel protein MscL [Chryseobacterium taklimakanense]MCG7280317.1 large conductance mechanosensitive channel protein MscL [Chryseobacterium taklimakanense]